MIVHVPFERKTLNALSKTYRLKRMFQYVEYENRANSRFPMFSSTVSFGPSKSKRNQHLPPADICSKVFDTAFCINILLLGP